MNDDSQYMGAPAGQRETAPILIVPYMWIGDFVRCHTVVRLLQSRFPASPIDVLATAMVSPLLDYMPGVRQGIVWDLPRKRLAWSQHRGLAQRLRRERYGRVLVMPRTWKSALAPYLAGIPERTGFAGEVRFGLLNDMRWGERALPRMVDRCAALALPKGAALPADYPLPELKVPAAEIAAWRQRYEIPAGRPIVAFAPGAVGPSKRWPASYFAETARRLGAQGFLVLVLGGPGETALAAEIGAG
ncbi:MAG TPA: lipopolysaccharide heptosyltransferase II, partial [Xanthobacteraceae bacterium]